MFMRRTGHAVLVVAVAATLTAFVQAVPQTAHADPAPVPVITSPSISNGGPVFSVVANADGTTTVHNPGGTFSAAQVCAPVPSGTAGTVQTVCTGTSDKTQGSTATPPVISSDATTPDGLPGTALNSLIEEGVNAVAIQHGVAADDMVRAYARPEIRAYVAGRVLDILNKKLYGKPMTDQENAVYAELEAVYKQRQVEQANQAEAEYADWNADPCAYDAPAPPAGTGLPFVPNDVQTSSKCVGGPLAEAFTFTNSTPPASTFDTWASYRHPTPSMVNGNNEAFKQMSVNTISSIVMAVGTAAALAGGIAGGFAGVAVATSIASYIAAVATVTQIALESAATTTTASVLSTWFGSVGATVGAFAGAVTSVLLGIVIGAVAIYQLVEDAQPGIQLADRVKNAAAQTDALGITSHISDYAGLDMATGQDPVGKPKADLHDPAFIGQLVSQLNEWQMFSAGGTLIQDPTTGYTDASTANDYQFLHNGVVPPQGYIVLLAPNGTVGRSGSVISGYRVRFSRGWLMVAEVAPNGTVGAYAPRLSVDYVDQDNHTGKMSLLEHAAAGQVPQLQFQTTTPEGTSTPDDPSDDGVDGALSDSFTYKQNTSEVETVTLQKAPPVVPTINVIPTAEGTMTVDHNILLKANASTGAPTTGVTYTWVLQRLGDDGSVAETLPDPGNAVAFQRRFSTPGKYRALVTLSGGQASLPTSGRIDFVVAGAAPEIITSDIQDSRALNGALSLNLRMLQDTRPYAETNQTPVKDDFTVKVDWATAADGSTVSQTYQVQCSDAGEGTCDTGPLTDGPPDAPTNANWSQSPTFFVGPTESYQPYVNVTITNAYGQVMKRVFPITPGDQRPKYASDIPSVQIPAGTSNDSDTYDVVQVFPATLTPMGASQDLTIQPYYDTIINQLPVGLRPNIVQKPNGDWWLQLEGSPSTDSIGTSTFTFPFEQEPIGSGISPPTALVNLEVKAAVQPGYRAILLGVPAEFTARRYRNTYPDYDVQVAEVLPGNQTNYTPFTGTVMCKLVSQGQTVFDKPCAQNKPFPWPSDRITDTGAMQATVYVESATQQISADGPYTATLSTQFLNNVITTTTPSASALTQKFGLKLDDNGFILAPYTGYTVTCSQDGGAYKPCFSNGTLTLARTPGAHKLTVRTVKPAPNAATTTTDFAWSVAAPAKTLGLKVPTGKKKRGSKVTITGSSMLPGEAYVVKIGGVVVARGTATSAGTFSRRVTVPRRLKAKKYNVVLTGANARRNATKSISLK
ncbi:MAG: hypothetical protein JWP74_31 [Marmoricola sp.]|nr:hypothetical protein [Marmoricola sp.]